MTFHAAAVSLELGGLSGVRHVWRTRHIRRFDTRRQMSECLAVDWRGKMTIKATEIEVRRVDSTTCEGQEREEPILDTANNVQISIDRTNSPI